MADRILSTQNISISTASAQDIILPALWDPTKGNASQWGTGHLLDGSQWYPSDAVIYVFDNFTGSFELVQHSTGSSGDGINIYPTSDKQVISGPWRLKAEPPRYLITSGSNQQT